jgi:hypothetical protein
MQSVGGKVCFIVESKTIETRYGVRENTIFYMLITVEEEEEEEEDLLNYNRLSVSYCRNAFTWLFYFLQNYNSIISLPTSRIVRKWVARCPG